MSDDLSGSDGVGGFGGGGGGGGFALFMRLFRMMFGLPLLVVAVLLIIGFEVLLGKAASWRSSPARWRSSTTTPA